MSGENLLELPLNSNLDSEDEEYIENYREDLRAFKRAHIRYQISTIQKLLQHAIEKRYHIKAYIRRTKGRLRKAKYHDYYKALDQKDTLKFVIGGYEYQLHQLWRQLCPYLD